ncbi:Vacuolar protease A [Dinochytrium kinnereticum]|nr:Vacuolar protease A [Dinochytrium kinnereticum]
MNLLMGADSHPVLAYKDVITQYYAIVQVGSPLQSVKALIDTGSYRLWVGPGKTFGFDSAASATYSVKDASASEVLRYFDGTNVTGVPSADSVAIGPWASNSFNFVMATKVDYATEGIIFIVAGTIVRFAYYINPDDAGGEISFGGYDRDLMQYPSSTVQWIPLADAPSYLDPFSNMGSPLKSSARDSGRWAVGLKTIFFYPKWSAFNVTSTSGAPISPSPLTFRFPSFTTPAIFDSGASVAVLPLSIVSVLGKALEIPSAMSESFRGLDSVDCGLRQRYRHAPVIFFEVEGVSDPLAISAMEYIVENPSGQCFLAVMGVEDMYGMVLFGSTVIKRYLTVFDATTRSIGLAVGKGRVSIPGTLGDTPKSFGQGIPSSPPESTIVVSVASIPKNSGSVGPPRLGWIVIALAGVSWIMVL